jgi:hypothetical protein
MILYIGGKSSLVKRYFLERECSDTGPVGRIESDFVF